VTHVIRPAARQDILRQYRYYLTREAFDAAARFMDAVEQSIELLVKRPEAGSPKPLSNTTLTGLRSWPVKDFDDFRIYYLVRGDVIRVIRVLHGKRDLRSVLARESGAI